VRTIRQGANILGLIVQDMEGSRHVVRLDILFAELWLDLYLRTGFFGEAPLDSKGLDGSEDTPRGESKARHYVRSYSVGDSTADPCNICWRLGSVAPFGAFG